MKDDIIEVSMFGGFSLSYRNEPLLLWQNRSGKAVGLLQYLIFHRGESFPKEKLFDLLYDYDSEGDPSNTFRVTVHRIKKMLIEAGLPNCQYISCKNGMCGWQSDVECVIDARLFEELIGDAEKALSESEKLKLYTKAFNLYKGEFLPASSTEDWVTVESVRYKELYAGCVRALTGILDKNGDHKAALDVYTKAGAIYPYDEDFQIGKIDELVNLKSFREALSTFECVTDLYFQELGLKPSDRFIDLYQRISEHISESGDSLESIKAFLCDDVNGDGAYYCNYLTFVDGYRFVMRIVERSGQSVFLMLCSLTDSGGNELEQDKLSEASAALNRAIKSSLRKGDLYTRYSQNQFLILLLGISLENCSIVSDRITKRFRELYNGRGIRLKYKAIPAQILNGESTPLKFKTEDIKW